VRRIRGLRYVARLVAVARPGMSPLTISVPILGALVTGTDARAFLVLGVIGLCAHLFGFGLNDLIDLPVDRTVAARLRHPLVAGSVKRRDVLVFISIQIPCALILYLFVLRGSFAGVCSLLAAITLSVVYNLYSKRGNLFALAAEISLAASIGFLCLAGSLTGEISTDSALFALALALVLLLLNSVPSGLKDIKTDLQAGAYSFVASVGTCVEPDDRLHIPVVVKRYSAVLQIAITLLIIVLLARMQGEPLLIIFTLVLCLYSALHLRYLLSAKTFSKVRASLPLLNGYYNYLAVCLCLFPLMPNWMQAVYLLLIAGVLSIPLRLALRVYRSY
jgi:4-hydroxybenzoate polyprenyltransferase